MAGEKSGVLQPEGLYSTAALGNVGIGRDVLAQARKDGVRPVVIGGKHWYVGKEVVDWILTQPRHGRQPRQMDSD